MVGHSIWNRGWCPKFAPGLNIKIGIVQKKHEWWNCPYAKIMLLWGIFLAKGQLDHSCTFWTMTSVIFSPRANFGHHPLYASLNYKIWNFLFSNNPFLRCWLLGPLFISVGKYQIGKYDSHLLIMKGYLRNAIFKLGIDLTLHQWKIWIDQIKCFLFSNHFFQIY